MSIRYQWKITDIDGWKLRRRECVVKLEAIIISNVMDNETHSLDDAVRSTLADEVFYVEISASHAYTVAISI